MYAYLILESGEMFTGRACGADRRTVFELVFNTSMAGYLEALTCPVSAGLGVLMTYPLIGNYGVCQADAEAERPWAEAFILRELTKRPSNFRSELSLNQYLERFGVPGIEGVDTRAITKILCGRGPTRAMLTRTKPGNIEDAVKEIRAGGYESGGWVTKVTPNSVRTVKAASGTVGARLGVLDLGAPKSLLDAFAARGCELTVYPAGTAAEVILSQNPDGLLLTPGPGDPRECDGLLPEIKALAEYGRPVMAIGLGHQVLARVAGFETCRQHTGHFGANIPVRDNRNGKTSITSQNHMYTVVRDSVDTAAAEIRFENVNDGTVEGLSYKNAVSVQFNPDITPNSKESGYILDEYIKALKV